ncbi:MAG: 5-bromo-4-chloroindolyl phosphate hydrolysis family protein [Lachnospiraceae bacterium]
MKDREVKELMVSLIAGIVAGGVFLGLLFLLKWNLLIDILLAFGIFVSISLIAKPRNRIGKICVENIINGEELHRRLEEAMEDFASIENSFKKIEDESVKEQVKSLKATAEKIIAYLEEHPEKITQARQFIDYYQETASSLLSKYVELQNSQIGTQEVLRLKENTSHALEKLNFAFEMQFQRLMKNEMLDMDAEIRLLDQTIKMESINS